MDEVINEGLNYLGYLASVIIMISMAMTSLTRIRIVNSAGAALFAIYGFAIGAYPVGILNTVILMVNLFNLYRLNYKYVKFNLIQTPVNGEYVESFVKTYQRQIKNFQPEFDFDLTKYSTALVTLRNMNVAGIIIGKNGEENTFEISLDFVVPEYRDMKVGLYVFVTNKQYFKDMGYTRIVTKGGSLHHENYLKKVGFLKNEDCYEIKM